MSKEYDLIIIGGGCAGYPAAVYAARFNLNTLVIAKELGGLITTTHLVENYPGFPSISGGELSLKLEEHVKANNVPIKNDTVKTVTREGDYFILDTELEDEPLKAKAVILATGTKHRHLGAPGEEEFQGKGVSYCATCDGMFYRNQVVGIIGGGDAAAKEAMVLAQNSKKVYMFVRSKLRAEPANVKHLEENDNIEIVYGVNVKEIKGDQFVTHVELDKEYNGSTKVDLTGLFISIGHIPQTELAKQLDVKLNERGEIIITKLSETNIEGVYSAGDVTDMVWKQGVIGSAEGSIAAYSAYEYISKKFKKD